MRVEQGFLAEVHGQRPEDVEYPGAAGALASVWVAAREGYRKVLEGVTLADVISGELPAHAAELIALENAWRSFGDPRAPDRVRVARVTPPSRSDYATMDGVIDRGSLLVARLHIDLALVSSAACRAQR
ncbi:hypothetical protein U6N30_04010 [Blastococcus brunescens]|uniref:Uncharacterized protein n=1 Tax=Blastococcus brunescens TaxID=1564165 RepID=A0ABZ1B287_9ACTN|nr:hypothetical protein [Blastococcus sp. BMG 8361]WRL64910.1 hypothetical protein U6N30_04010 [Blastococcus sp. BMG 8361]